MTTATTAPLSRTRPKLNLFGISFGLAGLAGTWSAAARVGLLPPGVSDFLWVLAATVWAVLIVRQWRGASLAVLRDELRDPMLGPFAALVPTTGMLLGGRLIGVQRELGTTVIVVMALAAAAFGVWFFSGLLAGAVAIDQLHSGYLLPTTAATLIGGQTMAAAGWEALGRAVFGVGILSWLMIGPVLLGRFAFRPAPPDALTPTFAIFSAPPAVAGNAWFALNGSGIDVVHDVLMGCFALLFGVQLLKVPTYLRLPFTLGWWALTFTTAASATYALQWAAASTFPGWRLVAWGALIAATGVIGGIAVRSAQWWLGIRRSGTTR